MKEETLSKLVEGLAEDEIIQNVDELVKDIRPKYVVEGREFLQVSTWLATKLEEQDEQVFPLYGFYIWIRVNNNNSALESVVESTLKDLAKLRIKWMV